MQGIPLSDFELGVIIGLKLAGMNDLQAAKTLEFNNMRGSRQSISRAWEKWQSDPQSVTQSPKRQGRPKKLDKKQIEELKDYVRENPAMSRKELEVSNIANNENLSGKSLTNYLKMQGFYQVLLQKTIVISEENQLKRVKWAKKLLKRQKRVISNCHLYR
ncbi:hypothetical protein ABPG72_005228 [Tetrahymena utriculariae]